MPITRVLHVHVSGPYGAPSPSQVQIACQIHIGLDDGSGGLVDGINHTMNTTRSCKQGGRFLTPFQMNRALIDDIKAHMLTSYGIPIDGYEHEFLTGGYQVIG